jgi:hypothetical protein
MTPRNVYVHPDAHWILSDLPRDSDTTITTDIIQPKFGVENIVVLSTSQTERLDDPNVDQYLRSYPRVILINAEPPADQDSRIHYWDRSGVDFVNTGVLNHAVKHMRVHRIETFFDEIRRLYRQMPQDLLNQIQYLQPRPLYFDALLGNSKPHRDLVQQHLLGRYPDQCLIRSYHGVSGPQDIQPHHYTWPHDIDDKTITSPDRWFAAQLVPYHGIPAMICLIVPIEIYNQCAYSVVAETLTHNSFSFFTEKVAKPILGRRLFVVFAGQYYLRNLRSLGFETFDGVIDESYDLEPDPQERWRQALDQIDLLMTLDQRDVLQQVRHTCEHNFNVMMDTDWSQQRRDVLAKIIQS